MPVKASARSTGETYSACTALPPTPTPGASRTPDLRKIGWLEPPDTKQHVGVGEPGVSRCAAAVDGQRVLEASHARIQISDRPAIPKILPGEAGHIGIGMDAFGRSSQGSMRVVLDGGDESITAFRMRLD